MNNPFNHSQAMTEQPLEFDAEGLPWSSRFGDHYYSRNDGRAETAHVFLAGNGLPQRWEAHNHFTIGELGFGTGLNFVETWHRWTRTRRSGQKLDFISLEAHPVDRASIARALSAWPELDPLSQSLVEKWPIASGGFVILDAQTRLMVLLEDVETALNNFPQAVDAWYLDGFAPARNPDMWSKAVAAGLVANSGPGTTLASYTSAGWVRRNLAETGFSIQKRPGFGTKRDMIVGRLDEVDGR